MSMEDVEKTIDNAVSLHERGERRGREEAAYAFSEIIWKYKVMPFTEDAAKALQIVQDEFHEWCRLTGIDGAKLCR